MDPTRSSQTRLQNRYPGGGADFLWPMESEVTESTECKLRVAVGCQARSVSMEAEVGGGNM